MFEVLKTTRIGRRLLQPAAPTLRSAIALAGLAGIASGLGMAQTAGTLDTTFGTGGTVTTNPTIIGGSPDLPFSALTSTLTAIEQSNGSIAVVIGINRSEFPNLEVFGLVRYTPDGALIGATSASFLHGGISSPNAAAAASNGDIVVAGTASAAIDGATSFAVARFKANGQPDTTFGTGGKVLTTPAGIFPSASALLVQPNGQILVGGATIGMNRFTPGGTVLVRYNSDGSLDSTFGTSGITEAVSAAGSPTALAQLSDGSYLALGDGIAEFSPAGVLQSKVTPGKLVASTQNASSCCAPILFQPNGDILVAKVGSGPGSGPSADDVRTSEVQVSRFTETGAASGVSPAFGFGGNDHSLAQAMALQSNGQIVVAGLASANGTPVGGGLGRLDSDLQLDTTFASGGSLISDQQISGLLIQSDGKLVAVGAIDGNLVLARYLAK
jgi:uncharacterized delta-60 repeat protein